MKQNELIFPLPSAQVLLRPSPGPSSPGHLKNLMSSSSSSLVDWDALGRAVEETSDDYFRRLSPPPAPPLPHPSSSSSERPLLLTNTGSSDGLRSSAPFAERSIGGSDTNIILDALSASTNSFKTDLQQLASTHSNTFSSIFQSNKENRTSIQDLNSQHSNLARLVGQLESELQMLKQRQMLGVETLDHANSLSAKHQLWISHADNVMGEYEMKHKLLQQQMVQLSMSTQNFVGRSELDATLGNFIGSNKSQWKGVTEAFEGRMGDMERMQTTIAKEVASVRTSVEGLLGGGVGGVALEKSKFADAIFAKVEKMFEDRVGVVLEKILADKAVKDRREEEAGGGGAKVGVGGSQEEAGGRRGRTRQDSGGLLEGYREDRRQGRPQREGHRRPC